MLQTVKKNYNLAMSYRTYSLADRPSRYDDTLPSYIVVSVKKVKLQIKAGFFNPKGPIFITGFLATLNFACHLNKIHKGAAMWALPHYVQESLARVRTIYLHN